MKKIRRVRPPGSSDFGRRLRLRERALLTNASAAHTATGASGWVSGDFTAAFTCCERCAFLTHGFWASDGAHSCGNGAHKNRLAAKTRRLRRWAWYIDWGVGWAMMTWVTWARAWYVDRRLWGWVISVLVTTGKV